MSGLEGDISSAYRLARFCHFTKTSFLTVGPVTQLQKFLYRLITGLGVWFQCVESEIIKNVREFFGRGKFRVCHFLHLTTQIDDLILIKLTF